MADDFSVIGLKEFNKEVKDWGKKQAPRAFAKALKFIAFTALEKFVDRSPVGNPDLWKSLERKDGSRRKAPDGYTGGRMRANWQVSVNRIPSNVVAAVDRRGDFTVLKGQTVIQRIPATKAAGSIVFITNNVPYIQPIEEGHSSQTPEGTLLALTIAELRALFNVIS